MGIRAQGSTFFANYLETGTYITSVDVLIQRESDGLFLDFSDLTFKASGHVTPARGLTEVTPPGQSLSVWRDVTGYVLPAADTAYLPIYADSDGGLMPGERVEVKGAGPSTFRAAVDTVASVSTVATVSNPVDLLQTAADKVWASTARTLTSFGTLSADIWNRLTNGITTVGSIGRLIKDMAGTTFNTTTDSLEALRNRGDAAWVTGAGGGGLTQQQVRDAMDLNGPFNTTSITTYLADIRNITNGFLFKQEDQFSPHYLQVVLADNVTHGGPNCVLSARQMALGTAAPIHSSQWTGAPLQIDGGVNAPGVRINGDTGFNQPAIDLIGGGTAPGLAGTIADLDSVPAKVWNEATATHQAVGSTGKALTDAQSAGDPMASTVPGAYPAGTAGNLIGNLLDAAVSSRQPSGPVDLNADQSGVTVGTVTTTTALTNAVNLAAGQVVASVSNPVTVTGGGSLTSAERTAIADTLLDRDMAAGTDTGSNTKRTVRQALRMNRNKVAINGGTLTVSKEDDIATSHTAAVTTAAGDPIVSVDPA